MDNIYKKHHVFAQLSEYAEFYKDLSFSRNAAFIKPFGELMILQTPEDMADPPPDNDGHYTYLMQFLDGTRINLSLFSLENIRTLSWRS
jgi:hypothetical protein